MKPPGWAQLNLTQFNSASLILGPAIPKYRTEPTKPLQPVQDQTLAQNHRAHSHNNHRDSPIPPSIHCTKMAPAALLFNIHTDDWGSHRTGVSSLATAVGGFLTDLWGSHRGGSTSAAAAASKAGAIVTRSIEHGQGVFSWVVKSLVAGKSPYPPGGEVG